MENGQKKEYYTFPGGNIENSKTALEMFKDEILQQLGIRIVLIKKLFTLKFFDYSVFLLCKYESGIIGSGTKDEYTSYKDSMGLFIPTVANFDDLRKIRILPDQVSNELILNIDKSRILESHKEQVFDFI